MFKGKKCLVSIILIASLLAALIGAFLIIPAIRYEGALRVAVDTSMVIGAAACFLPGIPRRRAAVAGTAAVVCVLFFAPSVPTQLLKSSPISVPVEGEVLYYDVGSSADVVVVRQNDGLLLRSNGLPEATLEIPATAPKLNGESWMAPLAVLARPRAESLLIVGYGGGRTVRETPYSVASYDVIVLEPNEIPANRVAGPLRTYDPLADPRVQIIENDARGALMLTNKHYDLVISQPSHPWTAGASHLHTREFARQVRDHLTPGGVFVQWSNVFFLDEDLLRAMVATLLDVFPHVRLYRPDPDTLLFLASDAPMAPETTFLNTLAGQVPSRYVKLGIGSTEDLVAALALDTRAAIEFAADTKPITDDYNRLATTIVYDSDRGLNAQAAGDLLAPWDVLQDPESFVYRELTSLDFGYIGSYLESFARIDSSVIGRIDGMARALGSGDKAIYLAALAASLSETPMRNTLEARLAEALKRFPDSGLLRYKTIEPYFAGVAAGTAPADILEVAAILPAEATSVLAAAGHAIQGEWAQLAAMDDRLAETWPTAAWAAAAAQLRVEWRLRVQNPELVRKLSEEALDIIDAQIVRKPNLPLLSLRAWAGYRAGSSKTALGSISILARRIINTGEQLSDGERASLVTNLEALSPLIEAIAAQEQADMQHVAAARSVLVDAMRIL